MREFKFRVWHPDDYRIYYFSNFAEIVDWQHGDEYRLENEESRMVNYMQSTGLKDKNGVEIFEGDIVRWKDLESFDVFPIDEVFKVEYSDEFMKWIACYKNNLKYKSDLQDDLYDFTDNRDLEVIGNIYENPELLEVE